jgi:biopolymer transport protein ExbD
MRTLLVALGVLVSWFVVVGASAQSSREGADTFVLSVDRQGSFSVAGDGSPLQLNESSVVEQALAALRRGTALVVEADERAPFESVKRAAQLLQEAGATSIGFRTRSAPQP